MSTFVTLILLELFGLFGPFFTSHTESVVIFFTTMNVGSGAVDMVMLPGIVQVSGGFGNLEHTGWKCVDQKVEGWKCVNQKVERPDV